MATQAPDVGAIVSCVDADGSRGFLADAARWLRIPFVEAGFHYPRLRVTAFSNSAANAACWRCLKPQTTVAGFSCEQYAAKIQEQGGVPATPSIAAVGGALVAEVVIQELHGNHANDGRMLSIDIRNWRVFVADIVREPLCPGIHRSVDVIRDSGVMPSEPIVRLLEASDLPHPELLLPSPFVVSVPCAKCGSAVSIRKPARLIRSVPSCDSCPTEVTPAICSFEIYSRVGRNDTLALASCRSLGLAPGTIVEIVDAVGEQSVAIRLGGDPLAAFTRLEKRHAKAR